MQDWMTPLKFLLVSIVVFTTKLQYFDL